jgi:hypothetical protein
MKRLRNGRDTALRPAMGGGYSKFPEELRVKYDAVCPRKPDQAPYVTAIIGLRDSCTSKSSFASTVNRVLSNQHIDWQDDYYPAVKSGVDTRSTHGPEAGTTLAVVPLKGTQHALFQVLDTPHVYFAEGTHELDDTSKEFVRVILRGVKPGTTVGQVMAAIGGVPTRAGAEESKADATQAISDPSYAVHCVVITVDAQRLATKQAKDGSGAPVSEYTQRVSSLVHFLKIECKCAMLVVVATVNHNWFCERRCKH